MNFTNKEFIAFRNDFKEAIKEVENKHKISIDIGNITYKDFEFTTRLTGKKIEEGIEQKEFDNLCSKYGFKPSDYKRQFASDGDIYHLTGFNTRASRNPCLVFCINKNKEYVSPVSWVKQYLKEEN